MQRILTPVERAVDDSAGPILRFDPEANWTACFNRLVEIGPAAVETLAHAPAMTQRCGPDDLLVLMHTSLLRTLIDDPTEPKPTARCLESVGDVLYFELKVRGQPLGVPLMPPGRVPRQWHELYPAELDQSLASEIDAEADRAALVAWLAERGAAGGVRLARPLHPRFEALWAALETRYADMWEYEVRSAAGRCTAGPVRAAAKRSFALPVALVTLDLPAPPLFRTMTSDYNRARAACIWLGQSGDEQALDGLIARVGHPSTIVAYNAQFALRYSTNPRIRDTLERYNLPEPPRTGGESVRHSPPRNGVRLPCVGSSSRSPA